MWSKGRNKSEEAGDGGRSKMLQMLGSRALQVRVLKN